MMSFIPKHLYLPQNVSDQSKTYLIINKNDLRFIDFGING